MNSSTARTRTLAAQLIKAPTRAQRGKFRWDEGKLHKFQAKSALRCILGNPAPWVLCETRGARAALRDGR